jgi:hypothetical protein
MRVAQPYGKKLFKEVQYLRQTWAWWMVIISTIFPLALVTVILFADKETTPGQKIVVFSIVFGTNLINILVVYIVRLETVITEEAIFYRWWPFRKKYMVVPWNDVKEAAIKKYPFFNLGYHKRKGFGKVNVVKTGNGLQLALTNDQQIYLGTQRLPALEYAMDTVNPKSWKNPIS